MAYFQYLPNIDLAIRPIRFPWSEQQYKVAKNIFRRFKLSDSVLDTATYFKKYVIDDSERPDIVSQKVYGRSDYDWVIMMCNNIMNPYFDWPMSSSVLMDYINTKYDNPYEIKHYLTNEITDSEGNVVLPADQIVDEGFYKAPFWLEYDKTDVDFPEPENETILEITRKLVVETININFAGTDYQVPPTITISAPDGSNGELPAVRATATTTLSTTGTLRKIRVTSPGEDYQYPPIVTFDGGLAGESATAVIDDEGRVTEIRLDGTAFDTTVADNIYEFGAGTTIAPNGSGTGSTGGFDVGGTHLRFGDSYGTRYAILNPVDMTEYDTVRVYAVRGNGSNGGETPDINGVEDLYLRYQITDGAPDANSWVNLGIVIEAVPNGTGSGVLTNYDFTVPENVRTENVYFQLYQPGVSGPQYDHYGITTVNFINVDKIYTDANVYLANNPLDTTGGGASAEVLLNKSVASVTITNPGSYNEEGEELYITVAGGHVESGTFDPPAVFSATVVQQSDTFNVGDNITFSNGSTASVTSYTGDTMAIKFDEIDINNPITEGVSFTTNPTGVVKNIVSTTLSEPTFVDDLGNYFRYKLQRPSGTSGWEKLIRDSFRYRDPSGAIVTLQGQSIARPLTHFDYETEKNDKKREIYVLKQRYLSRFIQEMKEQLPYKKSSDYVSKTLKRSSI